MDRADVVVLGGGPAGLTAAMALVRRGRSVLVLEREAQIIAKAGETLGPRVGALLEVLGAGEALHSEAFRSRATVPFRGVRSAWGSSVLSDRPSVVHPLGEGWHVDRVLFEEMLGRIAEQSGVAITRGTGACFAERHPDGLQVVTSDGQEVAHGRFVIDASGRGAPATARLASERRWISIDRQVAMVLRGPPAAGVATEPELLLESSEDGWWYSVPQPDGTVVSVLLTDADLVPDGPRTSRRERLAAALTRTTHTLRLMPPASIPEPQVVRADTGFLLPSQGEDWCAVGDAAMAGDPLSGDGIERALESALHAADAIAQRLDGDASVPQREANGRVEAYLEKRASYYAIEGRWPDSLFWRRRRVPPIRDVPLWLQPVQTLRRGDRAADATAQARAESLVPRRALAAVLQALATPMAAHEALALLRSEAPVGDRRLLVALQVLVEDGLVLVEPAAASDRAKS